MKIGSRSEGFTVLETIIVLAVAGFLFLATVAFLNGKQSKTEFTSGTRDIQTRLQQKIDEVANGFYPNNGSFQCTIFGGKPKISNGNVAQGSNTPCIFLGKVIQFDVNSQDPEVFNIYSAVGLRETSPGNLVQNLNDANPQLISQNGDYEIQTMPYGMRTQWIKVGGTGTAYGAVGFISSLGYINDSGVTQGPTQQVDVYAVPGNSLGDDKTTAVINALQNGLKAPTTIPDPDNGVQICIKSGGTNQSALYTIGGDGRQLTVGVAIKPGTNC